MLKGEQNREEIEDETDKTYGYDDFDEADYGEEGFANESTNLDNTDYDISTEIKIDSPMKVKEIAQEEIPETSLKNPGPYKEDTDIDGLPEEELANALKHYKAMLRSNKDNISKLEIDIQNATKKLTTNYT